MQTKTKETLLTAAVLVGVFGNSAFAQVAGGDVLGVTPVANSLILVFKVVATMGLAFGFVKLMAGRHPIEAMVVLVIGALGIGKITAIAQYFGLGG